MMLSKDEALRLILDHTPLIADSERVPFHEAVGRILAADVVAPVNLPHFDNSAMDGYAVLALDTAGASQETPRRLRLIGEIRAGDDPEALTVRSGQAVRIMTGAPMPRGADAVVMVENAREREGAVEVLKSVTGAQHVRFKGEDVRLGETVLKAGHRLRPGEVGVLGAMGVLEVSVRRRPRVGVISTGDEIVEVGRPLPPGKIYDSNRWMLLAGVSQCGADALDLGAAVDTMASLRAALERAIESRLDAVVTIGGVSAGRYDLVGAAMAELGFEIKFHKVSIKPGKPLLFARHPDGMLVFGLPGNPVSALITFELFGRPAVLKMQGLPMHPQTIRAILDADCEPAQGRRTNILRVKLEHRDGGLHAIPLARQGSHMLTSLIQADGYIEVASTTGGITSGSEVEVFVI
ncbi:MAG: molybdopterin molybdotransferase MoeA [Candidatus Sumerlaeia bacterium]